MSRDSWVLVASMGLALALGGCRTSLPLGGIAPGRGQPIGRGAVAHLGMGRHPELVGTLTEVFDGSILLNPIPTGDSLSTGAGGFDAGMTVGFVDWFDLGISRSRGLHAMVRLLGGDRWAWSVSPALYWYRTSANGGLFGSQYAARTSNRNVTSLVSGSVPVQDEWFIEAWAGGGYSAFDTRLGAPEWAGSGDGTSRSMVFGARVAGQEPREIRGEPGAVEASVVAEIATAWIRQRNGRKDRVAVFRLYLTLGSLSRRSGGEHSR